MKANRCFPLVSVGVLMLLFYLGGSRAASAQTQLPLITGIKQDRTQVVVTASVPVGIRRVTLEGRDRLGALSWAPQALARLDGSGGTVTFRVPASGALGVMRVRGDSTEPLPASFFSGTNAFLGQATSSNGPTGTGTLAGGVGDMAPTSAAPTGTTTRDVVESDIWKQRGQTLYFFNQYRGLQVIDLTNPDAATVRGTFDLPAAGEQMYLLSSNHVVLLAQNGCFYDQSQVLIIADTNGPPAVVARLPVPGYIQESRMVGTALYVASQSYLPVPGTTNTMWQWGALVSSFDLSDPNSPVARGTLWYSGYGNVVSATDVYLFVVTQSPNNWWQSVVRVIDITAPDGTMSPYASITTAGAIQDKFKLNYAASVFTAISEDWHWDNGTRLVTKLETFHLPDPRSMGPAGIIKLGELELGQGERLRATRFDNNRVYVVTFFQIDPLWVVDLSNPATPRIAGSVQVPGWSTYIEPLDDRLVTLGVASNRVAVSLFDVGNPAAPALLSRVLLGENFSWSEANYTEKAFAVLPDAGLILVPYNGDFSNLFSSAIQIIDLLPDALVARGRIEGDFQFRRAAAYTNRILSLSNWQLLSVDATDQDNPVVRGRTELAWPVDRVFLAGDYLIEIGTQETWFNCYWGGNNGLSPVLRVTLATSPDVVLSELTLTNLPLLGADLRDGKLYVAQGNTGWFYPLPLAADGSSPGASNAPNFLLTIVGLDTLPTLNLLSSVTADTQPLGWSTDWQAVWPKPDVLVWAGGGQTFWPIYDVMGGPVSVGGAGLMWPWPPFWGGNGGHLLAFDVSDSTAPRLVSEIDLVTNNWWSFSKAFAVDGLVYLSHQQSDFIPWLADPSQPATPPVTTGAGPAGISDPMPTPLPAPIGCWVQRDFLDVVDYADPPDPLVRNPVNVPGMLAGLSYDGALLYTTGPHWTTNYLAPYIEYLDASAYDGVSAHLVDSLPLPDSWPHPVLVVGTNVFLGRPGTTTASNTVVTPNVLETWTLSMAGKFVLLGSAKMPAPASSLAEFPGLLVAQETDNTLDLFDPANPAALRLLDHVQPSACWWYDLSHAAGDGARGLWIPLGVYGLVAVPVSP